MSWSDRIVKIVQGEAQRNTMGSQGQGGAAGRATRSQNRYASTSGSPAKKQAGTEPKNHAPTTLGDAMMAGMEQVVGTGVEGPANLGVAAPPYRAANGNTTSYGNVVGSFQRSADAREYAKAYLALTATKTTTSDPNDPGFVPFACPEGKDEDRPKPGCVLDARRRADIIGQTGYRLAVANKNFGNAVNAIERERLAQVLRADDGVGWKMIINILFTVASRGLGDKVLKLWERYRPAHYSRRALEVARGLGTESEMKALAEAAKAKAAARQAAVATTMSALGRAARAGALAKAKEASKPEVPPSSLLKLLQWNVDHWADNVRQGLVGLDDFQLLGVHAHLHPSRHSITRYENEIRAIVTRYDNQVGAVGSYQTQGLIKKQVPGTLKQAVRIQAYGQTRMALCYAPQTAAQAKEQSGMPDVPWRRVVLATNVSGRYVDGDLQRLSEVLKRARFIRWIDDDMAALAAKENKARVGSLLTFNLTSDEDADKFSSGYSQLTGQHVQEITKWIEEARRIWIKKRGLPAWAGLGGVVTGVSR